MSGEEAEPQKLPAGLFVQELNPELDLVGVEALLFLDIEVNAIVVGEGNADDGDGKVDGVVAEGGVEWIGKLEG